MNHKLKDFFSLLSRIYYKQSSHIRGKPISSAFKRKSNLIKTKASFLSQQRSRTSARLSRKKTQKQKNGQPSSTYLIWLKPKFNHQGMIGTVITFSTYILLSMTEQK